VIVRVSKCLLVLTMGMLLWCVAFLDVRGEWLLMWQSKVWNGEEAAFLLFAILGIVLLDVTAPEEIEYA
jgi:predicted small integral membrane protein